jgi:hypothetical protein
VTVIEAGHVATLFYSYDPKKSIYSLVEVCSKSIYLLVYTGLFVFCGTERNGTEQYPLGTRLFDSIVKLTCEKEPLLRKLQSMYIAVIQLSQLFNSSWGRPYACTQTKIFRPYDPSVCTKRWPQTHSLGTLYTQHPPLQGLRGGGTTCTNFLKVPTYLGHASSKRYPLFISRVKEIRKYTPYFHFLGILDHV